METQDPRDAGGVSPSTPTPPNAKDFEPPDTTVAETPNNVRPMDPRGD